MDLIPGLHFADHYMWPNAFELLLVFLLSLGVFGPAHPSRMLRLKRNKIIQIRFREAIDDQSASEYSRLEDKKRKFVA